MRQLPIGKLLDELYDRDPARSFEHIAQEHEGRPFEANLRRSDEHLLPVELSLSRVTLPDDWFYVVVCRDISIRKEQEAALIELKTAWPNKWRCKAASCPRCWTPARWRWPISWTAICSR